tara:strand:- start:424 stop:804 length:381 start_codon:yes stop_codon:yes gene_type:complete
MKKNASKKLTSGEYLIFHHTLCSILLAVYLVYLLKNNKCNIKCLQKLDKKEILYSIAGAVTTIASSVVLINLVQKNNVSFIIPQIQPLVILLTITAGYLFFGESIKYNTMIGIGMIVVGLYIINRT